MCIAVHTLNNKHNTDPLDNKIIRHKKQAMTYITGKEQQIAFKEIKCRLVRPPVLHLPNSTGRFYLYSDTSKFAMGSTLLIAYPSKRLPEAAKNYFITELEMYGLAINITSFSH